MQSCLSSSKNRSGELSDAMEKSSDEYEGEREAETTFSPDQEDECEEDESIDEMDQSVIIESKSVKKTRSANKYSSFTIRVGSGLVNSDDYYGMGLFTINLRGRIGSSDYGQIYFGYLSSPIQETSDLAKSIRNGIKIFSIGLEYIHFNTPHYTFLGQYLLIGIEYNIMYWSYKNPFYADVYDEDGNITGSDLIKSDLLTGMDIHLGIGINLIQTKKIDLGLEVAPGVKFWWFKSYEGFKNDVFDPLLYVQVRFTFNLVTSK
jgi:hypothetical protein